MNAETRTASCRCQNLKVECEGEPASVALCSCRDCQRRTGSAFGIAAFFAEDKVRASGPASCYSTRSEAGHDFAFYFCPDCGSTVYWLTNRKPGVIVVAAGAFADPGFPPPTKSAFDEQRHPWLEVAL